MARVLPVYGMAASLKAPFEFVGNGVLNLVEEIGQMAILLSQTLVWLVRPPYRVSLFFEALQSFGIGSLFIVLFTGVFTGLVMAYQSIIGFALFNAETLVGGTVAISLTRELGPVLTGLMVAGRTGSAMTTEIGTMRVTEQIDAMSVMAVNPVQYLVAPRVAAAVLMMPLLGFFGRKAAPQDGPDTQEWKQVGGNARADDLLHAVGHRHVVHLGESLADSGDGLLVAVDRGHQGGEGLDHPGAHEGGGRRLPQAQPVAGQPDDGVVVGEVDRAVPAVRPERQLTDPVACLVVAGPGEAVVLKDGEQPKEVATSQLDDQFTAAGGNLVEGAEYVRGDA